MSPLTTVLDDIGLLVTNDPSAGEGRLGLVRNASVVIEGGTVVSVGPAGQVADTRVERSRRCLRRPPERRLCRRVREAITRQAMPIFAAFFITSTSVSIAAGVV